MPTFNFAHPITHMQSLATTPWATKIAQFIGWCLEPALLMINLTLSILYCGFSKVPPVRWLGFLVAKVVQIFLCIQLSFWALTIIRLGWSLVCIILCFLVDVVEDQPDRASMSAVVKRIYL